MIEFLTAEVVDTLISPSGMKIEILSVEGENGFFVKIRQIMRSLGYSGSFCTTSIPFQIANKENFAMYHVYIERLSSTVKAVTYGWKVDAILPFLDAFIARCSVASKHSLKTTRKQAASILKSWWIKEVLPKYGSKPYTAEVQPTIDDTTPLFYGEQVIADGAKPPAPDNGKPRVDFDKIHEQAQKLSEMMNVPRDTALKTIIKLESSRLGYDLSPLLEFLTKGE